MRSHWTNPTIIRRPTIAALSAAALLVACDQPAGPSRSSRSIVADAQAGTVSAHGNGQVANYDECRITPAECVEGGRGVDFSFDFSGANTGTPAVPVTGSFSVKFRETGDVVSYQGLATITPDFHRLTVQNTTCTFTLAGGTRFSVTVCLLSAQQAANSDAFNMQFDAPNGGFGEAQGTLVSGGMKID